MTGYFHLLLPELVLCGVACVLMLLGCSDKAASRKAAPMLALISLIWVFVMLVMRATGRHAVGHTEFDPADSLRLFHFSSYVKLLTAGVGVILLLLAWPTNREGTGNSAMNVGQETAEFFSLMLLSLVGIFLVASANDLIMLFLGIELASIPTYIMVSISRPVPVAQEAGVKYFFLGAMAAAVMLFGFSYLYGVTGTTKLDAISKVFHPTTGSGLASTAMASWQVLALVMLIAGFAFKLAAVPLHVYAGDVYQGAATPVTAFLSFVPKTAGMVALIKVLYAVGGPHWALPPIAVKLLWVVAVLTMTVGNAIATTQIHQVKRLFAYSSIAHSGYMLVGITALAGAYGGGAKDPAGTQAAALQGVLFYLAAYGVTNAAAFGVLMMLPSRETHDSAERPGSSAETMRDLAGQGRHHPALGLCMMVCCMSLTGIPLTVGFIGKLMLVKPALGAGFNWLAAITVINAAVSAAYYLRIVSTMFLSDPHLAHGQHEPPPPRWSLPIGTSVALSVVGAILLGTAFPLTQVVSEGARRGAQLDDGTPASAPSTVAGVGAAAAAACPLEMTHVSRR